MFLTKKSCRSRYPIQPNNEYVWGDNNVFSNGFGESSVNIDPEGEKTRIGLNTHTEKKKKKEKENTKSV